ncbi:MAG: substrate-binding domain-containing protein [Sutterella wadsworthensis]|nr:substrate-binding domain-containing protein [Sutterella wadsworthensis]
MQIELFYGLEQSRSSIGPATLRNDLIKILAAIDSERSIKRAAEKLETSYRYLWGSVLKWEATFGQTLVSRERGKPATLTALGRKLLWAERSVQAKYAVDIAKIVSELNTAFAVASDPKAKMITVAGCYDPFLSSLQEIANRKELILDYHFSTGAEGLRSLNARQTMVASFNFPEGSAKGSEVFKVFRPLINPERIAGCHVFRRAQGLAVAVGTPLGITGFEDIFEKKVRYASRAPGTGTYTLQQELLHKTGHLPEQLATQSTVYSSHMVVATAVASGEADVGLCVAEAAHIVGAEFIPLLWENYYLAWMKEGAKAATEQHGKRDLSRSGERIND